MPHGYSLPLSPNGTASLVPRPPWHYVGDFLVIEYWADPDGRRGRAARGPRALRRGPGPRRGAVRRLAELHRRRRPSCSTRAARSTASSSSSSTRCSTASWSRTVPTSGWIRDFALVRGWIQGFPKKLGSIWLTRTFGLDCRADPGVARGRDLRRHARRRATAGSRRGR